MDKKISDFLGNQNVFSFCTSVENQPHCASCMYVFFPGNNALVFASEKHTLHIAMACLNNKVAGTILPSKMETGVIKGIQFTGVFSEPENEVLENAKKLYYRKFPFALMMKGQLWLIYLEKIKMTDNTLGFGNKLFWEHA